MSVNSELLCSFELLKPLDSSALKSHIKKGRNKRQHMLNSPVSRRKQPHVMQYTNQNQSPRMFSLRAYNEIEKAVREMVPQNRVSAIALMRIRTDLKPLQ